MSAAIPDASTSLMMVVTGMYEDLGPPLADSTVRDCVVALVAEVGAAGLAGSAVWEHAPAAAIANDTSGIPSFLMLPSRKTIDIGLDDT
jgi:hypothetical protein